MLETVCGLGNRKDALFSAELEARGVEPYDRTIELIRSLRAGGFKIAVVLSSRNCAAVLKAVGATDLFDAAVDGLECARLGIVGQAGRGLAVLLDYDGTRMPIVPRPEDAVLAPAVRDTVARLARRCTVAIIGGSDLADVRSPVGVDGIVHACSHGFDIATPQGARFGGGEREQYLPLLATAEAELKAVLAGIAGVQLARKRYSIAVHYRNVADGDLDAVGAAVDRTLQRHLGLRDLPGVPPLYIGDDRTDEHAFAALRHRGAAGAGQPGRGASTAGRAAGQAAWRTDMTPWTLRCEGFDPAHQGLRETLCALGNGHFVTCGAAAESATDGIHYPGTYLAAGYDRLGTEIAGRTNENDDLVNMPNWLVLRFRIDRGGWFSPVDVEMLDY